jgi:hypothetical protein
MGEREIVNHSKSRNELRSYKGFGGSAVICFGKFNMKEVA